MVADDDGFVNPRKTMRMIGASDDDLKILITKRFVIPFENGVIVIKHWRISNNVRADMYKPTLYTEEMKMLHTKENMAYTMDESKARKALRIRNVPRNVPRTIGKVRLGKDRIGNTTDTAQGAGDLVNPIITLFKEVNPSYERLFSRPPQRAAADRLLKLHGLDRLSKVLGFVEKSRSDRYCPTITTPIQLEDKWAALEGYAAKLKTNKREIIV